MFITTGTWRGRQQSLDWTGLGSSGLDWKRSSAPETPNSVGLVWKMSSKNKERISLIRPRTQIQRALKYKTTTAS